MNHTLRQRSQLVLAAERGLRRESASILVWRALSVLIVSIVAFVAWGVLG